MEFVWQPKGGLAQFFGTLTRPIDPFGLKSFIQGM